MQATGVSLTQVEGKRKVGFRSTDLTDAVSWSGLGSLEAMIGESLCIVSVANRPRFDYYS